MKRLTTLFVAALLAANSNAQTGLTKKPLVEHLKVIDMLQQPNSMDATRAKTTATIDTVQRIVAQSTMDNVLMSMSDSVKVKYSRNRRSFFDYNNMIFAYNYPYAKSPMVSMGGVHTTPRVQYDTFVHWTINPFTMPSFVLYEGAFARYDTLSNLAQYTHLFVDSVTNDNVSYRNTFNSNRQIKQGWWFNLNAGTEDSAFRQTFTYDASNRLTADTVYVKHLSVWRIAARTQYSYDAANNLTLVNHWSNATDTSYTLPLLNQLKYEIGYDGSNRMTSVYTHSHNGTSLAPYVKDTFDYTGTYSFHTGWRQHQFDGIHGTWWPQYQMQKHLSGGLADTVFHQGWDSIANMWTPVSMDIVAYNEYKHPDSMHSYLYNWTSYSSSPDYTSRYYYEIFYDTILAIKVDEIATDSNKEILAYPNPAKDIVTIAYDDRFWGIVSIVDLSGKTVMKQSAMTKNSTKIDISTLSPGMYSLVLTSKEGKNILRGKLLKE